MARGIDHLVLCVNDLSEARKTYEALGFRMTPDAQHPFGTGNILAQLNGCFLEVLSVTKPEDIPPAEGENFSFGAFNQSFLGTREGMSMLVLESRDEDADRAEFISKNMHVYQPFTFQRQAKLPGGEEAMVGFSLTFTDTPVLDGLAFFTCKQWRPDLFWKPDYQRHANTATSVSDVFIVAQDIENAFDFLSGFADVAPANVMGGTAYVDTPRGRLSALTPEAFAQRFPDADAQISAAPPFFAGFELAVADLAGAIDLVKANGFNVIAHGDATWLDPDETFNCLISLRQA